MNRRQMIKKVESISTLPTLPVVAMELNRMRQDKEMVNGGNFFKQG